MGIDNLVVGMLIGMVMSVPFGAIGVICVKRILVRGKKAGLASGFGVAVGDSIFAAIAVFGVSRLMELIAEQHRHIQLVGGLFILVSGIWSFYHYQQQSQGIEPRINTRFESIRDMLSMMVMTLANPQTILGFTAAFAAGVRFYSLETPIDSFIMVLGVFLGSIAWWVILSLGLDKIRNRIQGNLLYGLHQCAAVLVAVLGVSVLIHAALTSDSATPIL